MASTNTDTLQITHVHGLEELEQHVSIEEFARHMKEWLKPWDDELEDIARGIRDALAADSPIRGFVTLAKDEDGKLVGGAVMLSTRMDGYIPGNLLLFIAVDPETRGQGVGGKLMEASCGRCENGVKLHVEHENPAGRLYERFGFTNHYREMRWQPDKQDDGEGA